jgi:nucleotide-binding universal stress UspA family protein
MPKTHQHIIVAVDFSSHAVLALEEAADLAYKYQARLTVVYVIPQVIFHPDWATNMEDTIDIRDIIEEAQKALTSIVAPYRQKGLIITERVVSGGPYIEIVRLARELGADLIVVGAHGAAPSWPALIGSVAENVMRSAPCSVLTVREPAAAPSWLCAGVTQEDVNTVPGA